MAVRLLIVQYAGDYREAVGNFALGGDETYHCQKYSVDAVAEIKEKVSEVATLCCLTKEPYNEMLVNGVRGIGAGFYRKIQARKLIRLVEEYNCSHLIIRSPIRELLSWAIMSKVKTLAILADSFNSKGVRNKIRNYQLANLLNNKQIDWVGNNNIAASISLAQIGVKAEKIIPWEWDIDLNPNFFSPKILPTNKDIPWQLLYVGKVNESKGVGDVLEAIVKLKAKGLSIKLKVAGEGNIENFKLRVRQLKIEDSVDFLGLIPNKEVIPLMRETDIVLVPTRHEYPEGFPKTIVQALCSRTPIVASDHPMFRSTLIHQTNAMIFPASDSVALTLCVEKLLSDSELYNSLSIESYKTWESLQIPVKWQDLINRWLFDSPENKKWLFEHRLSSGKY